MKNVPEEVERLAKKLTVGYSISRPEIDDAMRSIGYEWDDKVELWIKRGCDERGRPGWRGCRQRIKHLYLHADTVLAAIHEMAETKARGRFIVPHYECQYCSWRSDKEADRE